MYTRWDSNPWPNEWELHAVPTELQAPHATNKHTNMYVLQECIMYNLIWRFLESMRLNILWKYKRNIIFAFLNEKVFKAESRFEPTILGLLGRYSTNWAIWPDVKRLALGSQ